MSGMSKKMLKQRQSEKSLVTLEKTTMLQNACVIFNRYQLPDQSILVAV